MTLLRIVRSVRAWVVSCLPIVSAPDGGGHLGTWHHSYKISVFHRMKQSLLHRPILAIFSVEGGFVYREAGGQIFD